MTNPTTPLTLIDSSAWIEFLRDTGSDACETVDRLLGGGAAITEPVSMEILAGARDRVHLHQLRGLLGRSELLPVTRVDYELASHLFRVCRRRGETVRKMIDCVIAAVAIRSDVPLVHADCDFDVLERHTALRLNS